MMPKVRGKESTTLLFVAVAFFAETFVFMVRGTAADLASYGTAIVLTLGIWLGREGMEKFRKPEGGNP